MKGNILVINSFSKINSFGKPPLKNPWPDPVCLSQVYFYCYFGHQLDQGLNPWFDPKEVEINSSITRRKFSFRYIPSRRTFLDISLCIGIVQESNVETLFSAVLFYLLKFSFIFGCSCVQLGKINYFSRAIFGWFVFELTSFFLTFLPCFLTTFFSLKYPAHFRLNILLCFKFPI